MSDSLDVIMYFEEVRKEHLHKYLLLNKELNKHCNSALIIKGIPGTLHGGGPYGVTENYWEQYPEEYKEGCFLLNSGVETVFQQNDYSAAVFGCGKFFNQEALNAAKASGALTFQVSKVFGDLYYRGADYACYINQKHLECDSSQGGFNSPDADSNKVLYSNNFLFDRTGEGLPHELSRDQFCNKYGLDPNKDIFVYLPTAIQCVKDDEKAQEVYRAVCDKVDNLIIKCHPNEYSRYKADRVGYKWSYELYTDKKLPVLEQVDTHWCYEHVSAGIAYQSGIGIEFGIYDTPIVYVQSDNPKSQGVNGPWWKDTYSWVGPSCTVDEIEDVVINKKFEIKDGAGFKKHKQKYLHDPSIHGYQLLARQILTKINKWPDGSAQ